MLILTRKVGESIRISDEVVVTVRKIQRGARHEKDSVSLSIEAPRQISVDREEVYQRKLSETAGRTP